MDEIHQMTSKRLKGLFILHKSAYDRIYSRRHIALIDRYVDMYAPVQTPESIMKQPALLNEAEVIFSGWGMPKMDERFFDNAPNLKAVFYGSGSVKYFLTELVWEKGVKITSAFAANAIPVAEFTLGQIILSLKSAWYHSRCIRENRTFEPSKCYGPGMYGSTVGLVSLGMIARYLCRLLKPFNVNIIAYDPYIDRADAERLNVELCSLDEVFCRGDVVSLHAPLCEQTIAMIQARHLAMMKPYATFINTARGAIVEDSAIIDVLSVRPDLTALLDVTHPEPPHRSSPLYDLKNVLITPHIAGSMGDECKRMGEYMIEELLRYVSNQPLKWEIKEQELALMA